jgi:hypothetical protein
MFSISQARLFDSYFCLFCTSLEIISAFVEVYVGCDGQLRAYHLVFWLAKQLKGKRGYALLAIWYLEKSTIHRQAEAL